MTGKEFQLVKNVIDNEGFEYTFESYSNFPEVQDPEFHRLRTNYLQSRKLLAEYLGTDE